jgi:hypothetical protein
MQSTRPLRTVSRLLKDNFLPAVMLFCFLLPLSHSNNAHADTPAPTSLQEAYSQAPDSDVIKALDRTYEETLTADRPVTITLVGGYADTTWTERSGFTTLQGELVIVDGGLIIDTLVITSGTVIISDVKVTPVTATSVSVTWTTDHAADSRVDYGEIDSYGSAETNGALTTSHTVILSSLSQGTTYHYKVTSRTSLGAISSTDDATFATSDFAISTAVNNGNVSVMEVTGTYDITNGDGSINPVPRQEIAKRFLQLHDDSYDILVIFTTFPIVMPESGTNGFYLGVKNDVQGIGKTVFDNSALFGSVKLQGTMDMGNIASLAGNPLNPQFDESLATLAHQFMHRWGAYMRYRKADGTTSTALLGKDSSHWSYLLDSGGSYIYGNGWRQIGGGSFTSTAGRSGYSPLDLYLMGMIPKEEVPPMLLIDNPEIDKTQLPNPGATITGTAQTVTIDDIIAIEGVRTPNSTSSQKAFKIGYVILAPPGGSVTSELAGIESIRNAWAGRFAALTSGRGSITDVAPSIILTVESPAENSETTGPDVSVSGAVINTTGAETGITVNGIPATVSGSRFIANHVPLTEGPNTVTITATDVNGLTATATRTVTATPGNYLRIATNVESGTAPLDISITLNASFTITTPTVTITGPVSVIATPGTTAIEFTATLPVEGTYSINASAVGPDSETYSDTVTVEVLSKSQLDTILKAKWNGMRTALVAGNNAVALGYFSADSTDKYNAAFTRLQSQMPGIAANMQNIELIYVTDSIAMYRIKREQIINGQSMTISYYLYFGKGRDGIWRIEQF